MQRAGDPRALQRLRRAELLAQRHQARHFGLGDLDLLATEIGEAEVLHDIVVETGFSLRRHVEILQSLGKGQAKSGPSPKPFAGAASAEPTYKEIFICRVYGHARLARQQPRIDAFGLERRRPALVGRRVEQDLRVAVRGEPAVAGHFLVELAFAPAGIAERGDPSRRPVPFGDHPQHVDRAGHRENLALRAVHVQRVLTAPVGRMKHEAAARLDRPAVVDGDIRRLSRVDVELPQEARESRCRRACGRCRSPIAPFSS